MHDLESFNSVFASQSSSALAKTDWERAVDLQNEYLKTACEAEDVDEAVQKLMATCPSLFASTTHAWWFLIEEPHEDLETEQE